MSNRPGTFLVPAVLAVLIALSGCAGGGDTAAGGTALKAGASGGSSDAKKSDTSAGTTAVIAEQKFAATVGVSKDAPVGGTVTTTLRALVVSGKTMTLHWAFRWDNPDMAKDAKTTMYGLGAANVPVLTDTVNLKQYRPLCTDGSWQGSSLDQGLCGMSVIVSPTDPVTFHFTNHSTVEAWALFAAPQDKNAKVDVNVVDGWPTFSAVTPTAAK